MQGRRHGSRVELDERQLQRGMLPTQHDQRPRKQRPHRARERTDADWTGRAGAHGGDRCGRLLQRPEDCLGVPNENPPGGRERNAPAGAFQQRHTGFAFQDGKLL